MTIRYIDFADGTVLTAEQLLTLQDNGVVQVDSYAELTGLATSVNAAYVEGDHAFYIKKADNSWGSVGGLAVVQAAAPSAPQVGQIWFDTDAILPNPVKYSYEGSETVSNTSTYQALSNLAGQTVSLTEPAWVHISYGVVEPIGDNTAGINYGVQLSGATTRAVGAADACTSFVSGKNSVSNDFYAIFNAGDTVVTPVARKTGSGTVSVVNPYMTIAPIRWS
jgi:hypothetical protein